MKKYEHNLQVVSNMTKEEQQSFWELRNSLSEVICFGQTDKERNKARKELDSLNKKYNLK